ncbi:MAG: hypothetical protein ABSF65_05600 [Candidatus Bathyarchaeia archaeon]|jgi:hypothetical protein
MTKVKNKTYKTLNIDAKLSDELTYLSDDTGKPKVEIVRELIESMVAVGAQYKKFGYWLMINGCEVSLTFFGSPAMISGSNKTEAEINQEIKEKLVG